VISPCYTKLKCVWYSYRYSKQVADADFKLRKVYFFWVCPDTNAFEWLHDLLKYYDRQMVDAGMDDFLKYYIYLTRGWDQSMVSLWLSKTCGFFFCKIVNSVIICTSYKIKYHDVLSTQSLSAHHIK